MSKDGGVAFPGFQFTEGHGPHRRVADPSGGDSVWEEHAPGMTLRDYFAIRCLPQWFGQGDPYERARMAYVDADAMLAAREPQPHAEEK